MPRFFIILIAVALSANLATAQESQSSPPPSDPGRPSGPLNPPGKITPLTGSALTPLSDNYLGDAPDPTRNGFQNPPGYLPRGTPRRPGAAPPGPPKPGGDQLPIPMTLPPASTGRQGLPPQTWALLTPRQQDLHRQAQAAALASPPGQGFMWDDAGRYGEVRVMSDRLHNNRPCRDFAHLVVIDKQQVEGFTTLCRNANGSW